MSGETKQPELIASVAVFLPLAITAVSIRIWVRTRLIRNFGWDDITMILALSIFIVYCSALMIIVANGGGTHLTHLKSLRVGIVWTLVAEVSYLATILVLKVSLGLFFLRVVQVKWQRKVIYGIMVMSTIIQTFHAFFFIFQCGNPRHYPENMVAGKCISKRVQVDLAYEQAAVTTATDFLFALLPLPLLWNTTLDLRSKFSVAFVLFLGTSGSVCSIIRFKFISGLGSIDDFFWTAANISIWSLFEMAIGIIAGSLATMRPLFKKLVYKARSITQVGKTRYNRENGNGTTSNARILSPKKSYSSSMTKSQRSISEWKQTVDSQTYTTTCIGGHDLESAEALADLDERGAQLINLRGEKTYPNEIWSTDPDRSRIWPYADDQSIHKMVQIDVQSSEDDEPWARAGGGLWGQRMEDILKTPPRTRKGSRDDESIPEWDKLPDLIPPSRKGSEDSHRRTRSRSKSPTLVRITTR